MSVGFGEARFDRVVVWEGFGRGKTGNRKIVSVIGLVSNFGVIGVLLGSRGGSIV